jgi:hypothetical protein
MFEVFRFVRYYLIFSRKYLYIVHNITNKYGCQVKMCEFYN